MKACAQYQELLAAGAAFGLPLRDRQHLSAHVRTCEGCRAEAAELADAVALMPLALAEVPPSQLLRARLRARLRRPERRPRGLLVAAAAMLLAVPFGGLWLRERAELDKYAILRSPNLRTVDLRGQANGAALDARAFFDPDRRTWLVLPYRVPKLPASEDYELWLVSGAKPVRAGILSQDPRVPTRIEVPADLPAITAMAVTIEPKGGVPQPTGPVVMKADL